MKIRLFVTYFWGILMFIFFAFGGFYLISGKNIITGQDRNVQINNVLSETDEKITTGKEFVNNEIEEEVKSPQADVTSTPANSDPQNFAEIYTKVNKDTSYYAVNSDKQDKAVVSFNFGHNEAEKKYYFALVATGLDEKFTYTVFVASKTDTLKIGEAQKTEKDHKLAKELTQDLSVFTKVYMLKTDKSVEEFDLKAVVYSASITL